MKTICDNKQKTNQKKYYNNINIIKGNIPVNRDLLNKYSNVTELMNNEINNYDGKINVKKSNNIEELKKANLKNMNKTEIYHLALNIFSKYNPTNTFINNTNKIIVSNADIKESINKILSTKNQVKYLQEHIQIFSDLGDIIESATLSSQGIEIKKQNQKSHKNNNIWSYYLNGLKINNTRYLFEFDVVSRENGENHYRVQRLKKADISAGNTVNDSITPTFETPAFYDNIITKDN